MSVNVIDTLKPKNAGAFPVVEAADVAIGEQRLPAALEAKADVSALAETNAVVADKANASDVATATANLQEQINQIEISATAEAVVAPEVAGARVGLDGTSYPTLKDRLDSENEASAENINNVKLKNTNLVYWKSVPLIGTPNLANDIDYIGDTGINITTGELQHNVNFCAASDTIHITEDKYYLRYEILENEYGISGSNTTCYIGIYNSENTMLGRPYFANKTVINFANYTGAAYIRITFKCTDLGNALPNVISNTLLIKSDTAIPDDSIGVQLSKNFVEDLTEVDKEVDIINDTVNPAPNNIYTIDGEGAEATRNNITIERIGPNQFALYGTASGKTRIVVASGTLEHSTYSDSVICQEQTTDKAGTFGIAIDMDKATNGARVVLGYVRNNGADTYAYLNPLSAQNVNTITVDSPILLAFVCSKNQYYGTENDPTIITYNIRETSSQYIIEPQYGYIPYIQKYDNEIAEINEAISIITNSPSDKTEAISDAVLKNRVIGDAFVNNTINNTTRTPSVAATELISGAKAVSDRHSAKNSNIIRFAFITDIHVGGSRTTSNNPTYNINAFISAANEMCDFAVNAGDLITNYYNATYMPSLETALETEEQVHDMFESLSVPYYIAKGNHDIGINGFSVVEPRPTVYAEGYYGYDSLTEAIYRLTPENFDAYIAGTGDVYILSGYTYFDNQTIQEVCLSGYCPNAIFNNSDEYGWYYYFDISDTLRVIVLNDFYNNGVYSGTTSVSPYQDDFVASTLADALSQNLSVISISHTSSGLTQIKSRIDEFVNAGGIYIGHIHGHEHSDVYTHSSTYNNIGVSDGMTSSSRTLFYDGFAFDIFEINLENNRIYENRVGRFNDHINDAHGIKYERSENRVFSFGNENELMT